MRPSLFLVLLMALAYCPDLGAQSCGSYGRSYQSYRGYGPSYSYAAPSYSYSYPATSYSYSAPAHEKKQDYSPTYYRFLLAFPVVELPSYGAAYAQPGDEKAPVGPFAPKNGNGAGTAPTPAAQPQPNPNDPFQRQVLDQLKTLNEAVVRIDRRVEALERSRQPVPLPKQEAPPRKEEQAPAPKQETPPPVKDNGDSDLGKVLAETNRNSCAACHQEGKDDKGNDVPEKYGGGFVFSDSQGRVKQFTAEQREEIQRQLMKGKMPKMSSRRARDANVQALTQQGADAIFKELDRQVAAGGRKKE